MSNSNTVNNQDDVLHDDPIAPLDDLWNEESEAFASTQPISRRKKVRLPVSAHGKRGRPSRETRGSSRVRHRISKDGGMHRRRRKQIR